MYMSVKELFFKKYFKLKGQCHEMNNFYEGLKNQIGTVLSVKAKPLQKN
jgi:hypothetical protein